jgi:drug/metabolite transporter (DMT)-like permease
VALRREFVKPHGASGLRISARSTDRGGGSGRLATPPLAYLYLGVMVATWVANWPLMRLALAHTEPIVFASLRMAGSIAILAPILAVLRRPMLPAPTERLALFWIGLFQVTGFLVFSIIGLAIVAPGRAIVLAYTMPLWAIPLGLGLSREVPSPSKLAGVAVGFAGLIVFMNPALVDWTDLREVTGNLFLLLAAICWAVGSCLYGRRPGGRASGRRPSGSSPWGHSRSSCQRPSSSPIGRFGGHRVSSRSWRIIGSLRQRSAIIYGTRCWR